MSDGILLPDMKPLHQFIEECLLIQRVIKPVQKQTTCKETATNKKKQSKNMTYKYRNQCGVVHTSFSPVAIKAH